VYSFSNTSVAQGAEEDDFGLDPNGDNRLGIVLRVLKSAVWQYVLWSEIKECVDRLEKLPMARMSWPNQDQWSRHPQIKKEYESLWVMENMLSMETRYNLRTTYAGGPGRDLLERYIVSTPQGIALTSDQAGEERPPARSAVPTERRL
jgi:hypothetical protein